MALIRAVETAVRKSAIAATGITLVEAMRLVKVVLLKDEDVDNNMMCKVTGLTLDASQFQNIQMCLDRLLPENRMFWKDETDDSYRLTVRF